MKSRFLVFPALLLVCTASCAAGAFTPLAGVYEDIATDGVGVVWALPKNGFGEIAALEGGVLVRQTLPELKWRVQGVALATMANGEVMAIWKDQQDEEKWYGTFHRGKEKCGPASTFRGQFRNPPRITAGSDGTALITGDSSVVVRFKPDHSAPEVTQLPDGLFLKPSRGSRQGPDYYVPILAVQDARHEWWLWSAEMLPHNAPYARLSGLVHFMGPNQPSQLVRVPGDWPAISAVASWDEKNLAVAVSGTGLLLFPTEPAKPSWRPVPEPEQGAFLHLEKLFKTGDDWYSIATPRPSSASVANTPYVNKDVIVYHDPTHPVDVLWKKQGDGWKAVQRGLDASMIFGQERAWAVNQDGLIMSCQRSEPWMIPSKAGEAPFQLKMEMGFPVMVLKRISQADASHMVFLAESGAAWLWDTTARPGNVAAPPYERIFTKGRMLPDSRGHLWCIHTDHTFAEWDGEHWTTWPLPPEVQKCQASHFIGDDRDQGWFLPQSNGPTAILDFKTGQWRVFASARQALEAELPRGVKLDYPEGPKYAHAFSGDGRIAGFFEYDTLSLFENGQWREWNFRSISGGDGISRPPFFAPSGALCQPTEKKVVWQWQPSTGWTLSKDVPYAEGSLVEQNLGPAMVLRPGAQPHRFAFQTSAQDRLGTIWFLDEGRDFRKFVKSRDVPVFPQGTVMPFAEHPMVVRVLLDCRGGAFVDTDRYSTWQQDVYLHIPPRLPMPKTEATLTGQQDDMVSIKLGNKTGGETWYAWRLDDREWGSVQQKPEITVGPITGGDHRVEVRAYNAALEPDLKTATVTFRVKIDTKPLADRLIARLINGAPDQRESAARSLKNLGPSILPRLKAAREKAETGSSRWWLDAVIQGIEQPRLSKVQNSQ